MRGTGRHDRIARIVDLEYEIRKVCAERDAEKAESVVKRAVRQGSIRDLVHRKDAFGRTLLHWAAEKGCKEDAELLLAHKAWVDDADNLGGYTPLHLAATEGHKAMVELLLASKADVNARDNNGQTALHLAAEKGHKEVVELLLANKADKNATSRWDSTPFDLAQRQHHTELEELLRPKGARKLLHGHRDGILKWQRRFRYCLAYLRGRHACRLHHRDLLRRGFGSWPHHLEIRDMEEAMDSLGIPRDPYNPDFDGFCSGLGRGDRPSAYH